ncbi:hypothetical protein [Streptomyces sp. NPDC053069]|uniref:hypothetical protein n=1 Tax=Streptomyces sp. NPDC053069 TaxID=3365695 RepID=UPI0037CE5CC9
MTDGAQQNGQSANSGGSHGDGAWRYVLGSIAVSVVSGLLYQVHGCSPDTPDPAPTSTVTETMSAETTAPEDDVSSSPSVSAHITRILFRGRDSGNAAYSDFEVDVDFSGLRGQECVIKWSSYYPGKAGQSDTNTGFSGQLSTGLLAHDNESHWNTFAVHNAQAGWMLHVFVYAPDGTLLDQEDGPTA